MTTPRSNLTFFRLRAKASLTRLLLVIIFSVAIQKISVAQATQLETNTSESLDLKISTLEQNYDSQVYSLLSNYFDRKKFFVDVAINAEVIEEVVQLPQSSQIITTRQPGVLMPGLPFLPEENLRQLPGTQEAAETVVNESTIRTLRLINLNVNIYADSSFTAEEIAFMRLLTGIAAKIDDARGDLINIAQIPIPSIGKVEPIPIVQADPQQGISFMDSLIQYGPGFILLFLFAIIVFVSRYFGKSKQQPNPVIQRESVKNDFNISEILRPSQQVPSGSSSTLGQDLTNEIDMAMESFFDKPHEIALLFDFWIDDDPQNGPERVAKVIDSVDSHLLRTLRKDLQPENYDRVAEALDTLDPIDQERKYDAVRTFNSVLKSGERNSSNSQKSSHVKLFKFLDHISEKQIIDLLNDEGYQTGALVLNYLADEKAARIIDQLDKSRSANIMVKMTTLSSIPYQLQSEISSKLFDKAMDMVDKEKEQHYGAEHILPVLDKLPLNEQQNYINQLKATNATLGEIVQSQFITIDQVLTLTDSIIKNSVKDINTSTLLDAVLGLDQKIIDKILSVRPKREQKLIRLELEELNGTSKRNTDYAKSEMMASIRKTVNSTKKT